MLDLPSDRGDFPGVRIPDIVAITLLAMVLRGQSSQTGNLTFVIPANSTTTVNLTSTSGVGNTAQTTYPDETTASYAGFINTTIGFDPDTLQVTEFTYTGGNVQREEAAPILQIFPSIAYTGVETPLPTSFTRTSSSSISPFYRGFAPLTVNPPAAVDPFDDIVAGNHEWLTYVGFERLFSSRGGVMKQEVISTLTPPVSLPHRGTPSITLAQIGTTTFNRIIQATLTFQFLEEASYNIGLSAEQLLVQETGSWSATAQFNLPTDYSDWTQVNGLGNPDPEATNPAGIPWVFLYNLDLPPTTAALPTSFVQFFGEELVQITLPEDGLKLPMTLEYSTTMEDGSWHELPFLNYLDGFQSLDAGATGAPRFFFPEAPPCFMRFKTSL